MTQPMEYETRPPNTVTAFYSGGTPEELEACQAWAEQFLTDEDAYVIFGPQGYNLFFHNGAFDMTIEMNNYVYVDEDGVHCVRKDTFEMVYKKVVPVE